ARGARGVDAHSQLGNAGPECHHRQADHDPAYAEPVGQPGGRPNQQLGTEHEGHESTEQLEQGRHGAPRAGRPRRRGEHMGLRWHESGAASIPAGPRRRRTVTIMRAAGVRIAVVGIMAAALLTACDNGEPRAESLGLTHTPSDLSELEGGAWVTNHVTVPDVTLVSGTEIEMHFKSDSISVNAGCNTMFGSASIEGDELV